MSLPCLRLVHLSTPEKTRVELARIRHGKPFAIDKGSTWKRGVGLHDRPFLTRWVEQRHQKDKR